MTLPDVDATTAVPDDPRPRNLDHRTRRSRDLEDRDERSQAQRGRRQGFQSSKGGRQDRGRPANVGRGRTPSRPADHHKESFDVSGLPTSWGVTSMSGNVPASSAIAVRRLEDEGGSYSARPTYRRFSMVWVRRTKSTVVRSARWEPICLPGGSSSGSAVAVRAGFSYLDIGSDLSGSIRHPASFCGLFGHSPSLGLVPQRGHSLTPAASRLSICPRRVRLHGRHAISRWPLDVISRP